SVSTPLRRHETALRALRRHAPHKLFLVGQLAPFPIPTGTAAPCSSPPPSSEPGSSSSAPSSGSSGGTRSSSGTHSRRSSSYDQPSQHTGSTIGSMGGREASSSTASLGEGVVGG